MPKRGRVLKALFGSTAFLFVGSALLAGVKHDYANSWAFYNKRVVLGASPAERKSIIERIERKYWNEGVDLTPVEEEKFRLFEQYPDLAPQVSAGAAEH